MPGVADRRIGSRGPGAVNLFGENRDKDAKLQSGDQRRKQELHDKIYDASTAQEMWRPDAIESLQFCGHEQWREADAKYLDEQNRPRITINKILPKVQYLLGVFADQRTEPTFAPVEAGDVKTSEVIRQLYKYHQQAAREADEQMKIFRHKIVTGIGWAKIVLKFDRGDIEGRPALISRHPLSIFPDPNFWDGDRPQMNYVVDAVWATKKEAQRQWPDHKDEIEQRWGEWMDNSGAQLSSGLEGSSGESIGDSIADRRSFWAPDQQRMRIAEIWEVETEESWVALMPDGKLESDQETVKRIRAAILLNPELQNEIAVAKAPVRKVTVSHLLDDLLLSDALPSPFDSEELPFFPSICYYFWRKPFGIVEGMKDLNRELNVHRGALTEVVKKAPNVGWLNSRTGGAKTEDIETYAKGSGAVINYDSVAPQLIRPPDIPQVLIQLEQKADQDMKDVSLLHDEMTGATTQKTVSGRAIEARQRGGMTAQEQIFESFRNDMGAAAAFLVKAIQQYCSPTKARRILGQMIQRNPSDPNMQAMAEQDEFELQEILSNAMATEFDVLIRNDQPYEPSLKVQLFETLTDLAQKYPNFPPPPNVMIRAAKEAGVIPEQDAAEWQASVDAAMQAQQQTPPEAM